MSKKCRAIEANADGPEIEKNFRKLGDDLVLIESVIKHFNFSKIKRLESEVFTL